MNKWNIPGQLEQEILARDQACVYCGVTFMYPAKNFGSRPSWEHIVNDTQIISRKNIARCCMSCNASKGAKELMVWLQSAYCAQKGIGDTTVAQVVRDAVASSKSPTLTTAHV